MPAPRIAVALMALAVGCDGPTAPEPEPVPGSPRWREAQALSVEEAVHRFQFGDYRLPPGSLTYCLARNTATGLLPWTDPAEALLRRFVGHQPPVKKVSLCRMDVDVQTLNGVTDVETGGPAVIFRVGPLNWASDTEVVLDGGHHFNGLNGSGKTYRVRFQTGAWVVVEAQWRWIS